MSLLRYESINPLFQLQREVTRLLDERSNVATSDWAPLVDIKETPDQFVINADVPGVDPKAVDVTMEDGVLTIRGSRDFENVDEQKDYKRIERSYGTFYRRFTLPDSANADKISAKSKNGVLEVVIPKLEKVQPKRISVSH